MAVDQTRVDYELARLAALERLRAPNNERDYDFDDFAQAAALLFDMPVAFVSLIDERRSWFRGAYGTSVRDSPRDIALCAHVIAPPAGVLVVPDTLHDERFVANPLVTGEMHIRFYAGAPLVTREGLALGTLCVIDRRPRTLSAEQCSVLSALATLVMHVIEEDWDSASEASASASAEYDEAGSAVFGWDEAGRITLWTSAAQAMLGWTATDVVGKPATFLGNSDLRPPFADGRELLRGSRDAARSCTLQTKDGAPLAAALRSTPVSGLDGPAGNIATIELIAQSSRREAHVPNLHRTIGTTSDSVMVMSATPVGGVPRPIIYVNAAFTKNTGYTREDATGKAPFFLHGRGTETAEVKRISAALDRYEAVSAEIAVKRKDGGESWMECRFAPVVDATGRCRYFIVRARPTAARSVLARYERARQLILEMAVRNDPFGEQLAQVALLLRSIIPGSLTTIMLVRGGRLFVGAADPDISREYLAAIDGIAIGPNVGSCGTAVFGRVPVMSDDIETDARWRSYRDIAAAAGVRACWSVPMFAIDGEVVGAIALYSRARGLPSANDRQRFDETVRLATLIVERHRDRQRLERIALYDSLTDLPNRLLIEDLLGNALARAQAAGRSVAVGVIDIDRFKAVNDAFGHRIGDELLRRIGTRLAATLIDGEVVGRMAGDAFIFFCPDLDDPQRGVDAATRIIDAIGNVFEVEGHEIVVRPSLGLATFPETSTRLPELLQAAGTAMSAAKARGGGLERAVMPPAGGAAQLLDLQKDLHHALERNEFELYYQLMFDCSDGRPVGAEALLRWNHPVLGLLGPVDFIPLAESMGIIVPIGTWVIGAAAQMARRWRDEGHDAFVTVNVSALQFDAPGLVATVVGALDRSGIEPHRLHLELTESLVMRNPTASAAILLQLKALGVRVVIDDFGTGYSSLAYLQRFSFDGLKIDRAFVRGIGEESAGGRSEHIVAAVVALASALGVVTIAEGVENQTQYAFAAACGCTIVQGFLCARPVPAAQLDWHYAKDLAALQK